MVTADQDLEHLKLLSIFHYVVAALAALFACFPFIHLFIGLAIVFGEDDMGEAPAFVGLLFICVAVVVIVCGWAFAVCVALAGRYLARREHYTFCLVMGGVACIFMPFGTVLGVFTLVVLMRPSVKALFGAA